MRNIIRTLWDSFSPLRLRSFRLYLGGQAISLLGTWMQITAQGWVVWQLSHSTTALGLTAMLSSLPILFLGPWAGVWADRLDRRRLLIASQTSAMVLAFAFAILVQVNAIQLWHIYVLSLLLGIVNALDMPTQQAFIGDLSGMSQVRKAVVVNAMIIQIGRMLGPALAGFAIGALGVATAFWLNGLSFLAVIASLLAVRATQVRGSGTGSVLEEYREGLRFIWSEPRIQDLLVFTILITLFAFPVINILPAVTTEILHREADVLGLLLASSGAGALVGTLFVAPLVQPLRRTGLVLGSAVAWAGLWVILFSLSAWLPLSLIGMFLVSLTIPVVLTTASGLIQTLAPPTMRARLLSTLLMVTFGIQPVASLVIGVSADHLGAPLAIRVNGVFMVVGAILLLVVRPKLREWEASHQPAVAQDMA